MGGAYRECSQDGGEAGRISVQSQEKPWWRGQPEMGVGGRAGLVPPWSQGYWDSRERTAAYSLLGFGATRAQIGMGHGQAPSSELGLEATPVSRKTAFSVHVGSTVSLDNSASRPCHQKGGRRGAARTPGVPRETWTNFRLAWGRSIDLGWTAPCSPSQHCRLEMLTFAFPVLGRHQRADLLSFWSLLDSWVPELWIQLQTCDCEISCLKEYEKWPSLSFN